MWELFIASRLEGPSQLQEQISGIFCHGLQLWCANSILILKTTVFSFSKSFNATKKTNLKQLGVFDAKIHQQKEDLQAASGLSRRHDLVPMALPVVFARVQVGNPPKKGQLNGPGIHKKMKQTPNKHPKKRKNKLKFRRFFWFESFDVIHCSIWRFVLSELL